jgi:hypothetical protein
MEILVSVAGAIVIRVRQAFNEAGGVARLVVEAMNVPPLIVSGKEVQVMPRGMLNPQVASAATPPAAMPGGAAPPFKLIEETASGKVELSFATHAELADYLKSAASVGGER